ncbi:protein LURP-one-related 6 [Cynara cardunculus var. scolymus]|uniref:LURP1-like domain-containing protein n=1 Tax=Cynara cardunculus var. scolymus TaxID=59895 RepID=A0A103XNJ5_CYNCS|nr:protein LURP-one-related 6 [Cynara cardunculus var. scolymus]KVH94008.1 LURP1-like domain-containing protein [Cynara cardunculus var. scolymus]
MGAKMKEMPVVSKMFCSSTDVVLGVRSRPHVVGGGGFVVTDLHTHQPVFQVDGCGVLGKKDQMTLTDAYKNPVLLIRRKGGIVEAVSLHRQWGGYTPNYQGCQKLVFTLKDPKSCFPKKGPISVSIELKDESIYCKNFQIKGYFLDRDCSIVDSGGNVIAQVGVSKEVQQVMEKKDLYHVVVKAGIDQAFVVGVIAILDYIHNGSTRC